MSPRTLRIGITIGLHWEGESLWVNGIKQNALNLALAFKTSPLGHRAWLVNTTDIAITPALPWDQDAFPTLSFREAKDDLDVMIELGGQLSPDEVDYLKGRGVRLVSYCCGAEYVQNIEAMIFRRPLWTELFCNRRYDQLWVIPQVAETSLGFFETLRRRPAIVAPFVWSPLALDQKAADLPHRGQYRPSGQAMRLAVMEPNLDILKFCLNPILIAEQVFRETPGRIGFLHVLRASALAQSNTEFIALMSQLDLVRAGKASFVGAFDTPNFLAAHTDIVVSHQWGLALNYLYFDVCWQGYALVHNAHLCPEIGYYYPESDLAAGAAALRAAIDTHDADCEAWREGQRRLIARFLATDRDLVAAYDVLLSNLLACEPAP
jgi:hypothetical protein